MTGVGARIEALRQEMRQAGAEGSAQVLADAKALVAQCEDIAQMNDDAVPAGLRQEIERMGFSISRHLSTLEAISGRARA